MPGPLWVINSTEVLKPKTHAMDPVTCIRLQDPVSVIKTATFLMIAVATTRKLVLTATPVMKTARTAVKITVVSRRQAAGAMINARNLMIVVLYA